MQGTILGIRDLSMSPTLRQASKWMNIIECALLKNATVYKMLWELKRRHKPRREYKLAGGREGISVGGSASSHRREKQHLEYGGNKPSCF